MLAYNETVKFFSYKRKSTDLTKFFEYNIQFVTKKKAPEGALNLGGLLELTTHRGDIGGSGRERSAVLQVQVRSYTSNSQYTPMQRSVYLCATVRSRCLY